MDMTIRWQVLSVHALRNQLYMLQVIAQQSTLNTTIWHYRHARKTGGLFNGTARASSLAPAIILLTWVP